MQLLPVRIFFITLTALQAGRLIVCFVLKRLRWNSSAWKNTISSLGSCCVLMLGEDYTPLINRRLHGFGRSAGDLPPVGFCN